MMKNILLCAVFALFGAGCCCADKQLPGTWVQPVPGMPGQVQGVVLEEGGKASSVNMATLVYETWNKKGDTLTLTGKSIGNGQTIDFTSEMKIENVNGDELVLSSEGETVRFTRQK